MHRGAHRVESLAQSETGRPEAARLKSHWQTNIPGWSKANIGPITYILIKTERAEGYRGSIMDSVVPWCERRNSDWGENHSHAVLLLKLVLTNKKPTEKGINRFWVHVGGRGQARVSRCYTLLLIGNYFPIYLVEGSDGSSGWKHLTGSRWASWPEPERPRKSPKNVSGPSSEADTAEYSKSRDRKRVPDVCMHVSVYVYEFRQLSLPLKPMEDQIPISLILYVWRRVLISDPAAVRFPGLENEQQTLSVDQK